MMTAHVVLEALDPSLPATMSAAVMGLLRRDLGYDGLVFSDDLEMAAVADHFDLDEVGRWGLKAGVDVFLVCHRADRQHHLIEGIAQALATGKLDEGPVKAAHRRLDALLQRFNPAGPRPDPRATLRRRDHLELAARLAGEAPAPGADPTGGRKPYRRTRPWASTVNGPAGIRAGSKPASASGPAGWPSSGSKVAHTSSGVHPAARRALSSVLPWRLASLVPSGPRSTGTWR